MLKTINVETQWVSKKYKKYKKNKKYWYQYTQKNSYLCTDVHVYLFNGSDSDHLLYSFHIWEPMVPNNFQKT